MRDNRAPVVMAGAFSFAMNPTTTTDTPGETGAAFVSVAAAALALGVSARTIRRRCKSGELAARFIGGVWEVDADSIGQSDTDKSADSRTRPKGQTAKQSDSDLNASADNRTPDAAKGTRTVGHADTDARPIGQPDETAFLRAQLDTMNRALEREQSAHEQTRQLLAGALQMAARQLPNVTPTETPEAAQGATANNQGTADVSGQQKPTARRGDGLALVRDGLKRMFMRK